MQKVLVSSCLLGEPVRYDGHAALSVHPVLARWRSEGRIVACCPELEGGLAVPRPAVELQGGDGSWVVAGRARAMDGAGGDRTRSFLDGACAALALCRRMDIRVAVLKERSPSCGSSVIYDGSFSGRWVPGQGVTTAVLRRNGVSVFAETQWEAAQVRLEELEWR